MSEVVQEIKLSKQDHFMVLYKPVHDRLNRFVHSMVWDKEDARDIIAETLLKAFENFDKIENHEAFLYYLFGIASRLAKQRSRRLKYWVPFTMSHAEQMIDESSDVGRKMEIDVLRKAMRMLPEKQREAISLFEISGFSLGEIQQIQGGSLSGVKTRIARARDELARLLENANTVSPQILFNPSLNKAVIG
jgi:RNA polymerase sigma-70 factor (ECF subfamily)